MENKITRKITQDNFTTEKIDVIENTLLGDYDNNGHYFIAPQIINELLDLKKHRKSSFGNSMFCIGRLLGYGEIVFELAFNKKTKQGEKALARLFVLENVDKINGYLQNTIKTKIAEFSSDVDNFIEESFKHFKVTNSEVDDEGRERTLLDDLNNEESFILAKKQYSLLLEKLAEDKFLDAYGKYFTFRISALTKLDNEFSQAVLDKFNQEYELIESVFLKNKNYKMLNELLDKCIESVSGVNPIFIEQEKDFNEKTAPALETFIASVDRLNEKFGHKALNMLDKDDRVKVEEIHEAENNSLEQSELMISVDNNGEGDGEKIIDKNIINEVSIELPNATKEDIPVILTLAEEQDTDTEEQSGEKVSPKEIEQSNTVEPPQESQTFKDIRDYFEREYDTKIEETSDKTTTETKETIETSEDKFSSEEIIIKDIKLEKEDIVEERTPKSTLAGVRVFDEKAKAEIPSYNIESIEKTDTPKVDIEKPKSTETISKSVTIGKEETHNKHKIKREEKELRKEEREESKYSSISKRVVITPKNIEQEATITSPYSIMRKFTNMHDEKMGKPLSEYSDNASNQQQIKTPTSEKEISKVDEIFPEKQNDQEINFHNQETYTRLNTEERGGSSNSHNNIFDQNDENDLQNQKDDNPLSNLFDNLGNHNKSAKGQQPMNNWGLGNQGDTLNDDSLQNLLNEGREH